MFADFERLIVMRVVSSRLEAEFVYDGPVAQVWAAAEAMQKNGQRKIRSGQAACGEMRRMSLLMAPLRHADRLWTCPVIGVERK